MRQAGSWRRSIASRIQSPKDKDRSLGELRRTDDGAVLDRDFHEFPGRAGLLHDEVAAGVAPGGNHARTIARGRLLCDAYEAYRRVSPRPRIDFEHAAFLVQALTAGDEIRMRFCPTCEALNLVETINLRDPLCRACSTPMPDKPTAAARASRIGADTVMEAARIPPAPKT